MLCLLCHVTVVVANLTQLIKGDNEMVNDIFKSAGIDLNESIELTEEKQKIVDSLSYESKPVFRSSVEPQTNYGKPNSIPRKRRYTYKDRILNERLIWRFDIVKESLMKSHPCRIKESREEFDKLAMQWRDEVDKRRRREAKMKHINLVRRIYKRLMKWLRK